MGFFSLFRRTAPTVEETGTHRAYPRDTSSPDGSTKKAGQKKGRLFLGVCDMKIATLFLNGLHVFAILLLLLLQLFGWAAQDGYVAAAVGICLSVFSIVGTSKYSYGILYITTVGLIGMTILYMAEVKIFLFILAVFLLFAQCYFLHEMRSGIMTQERYEAGTEEFITEEGRVVVETTNRIATQVAESSKTYGRVAVTSTQQAASAVRQQSSRALEQYVAPVLGMRQQADHSYSSDSDSSVVIVKDYVEV